MKYGKFAVILLIISLFFGCDDNPVDDNHDEENDHTEAVGLIILDSGNEIVRYENGMISGIINVKVNEETPLLSVKFIDDHDGDLFTPEDDHYNFDWTISNESIAEVEQHAEDGKWKFHIKGKSVGATTIEIKILHGDHADFVSLPIAIAVTQ